MFIVDKNDSMKSKMYQSFSDTFRMKCMFLNPLNATGVNNMHQVPMLTDNCGIERVKQLAHMEL